MVVGVLFSFSLFCPTQAVTKLSSPHPPTTKSRDELSVLIQSWTSLLSLMNVSPPWSVIKNRDLLRLKSFNQSNQISELLSASAPPSCKSQIGRVIPWHKERASDPILHQGWRVVSLLHFKAGECKELVATRIAKGGKVLSISSGMTGRMNTNPEVLHPCCSVTAATISPYGQNKANLAHSSFTLHALIKLGCNWSSQACCEC